MQKSDSIAELAKALAKAQGEFPAAKKDSSNPFFNSKYADLASVVDAIQGPLAQYGLSLVQFVNDAAGGVAIETVLLHESGEWIGSSYTMPVGKADAQGVGSAITYAKRYAMAAICRLATEDDDGNAAAQVAPGATDAPRTQPSHATESGPLAPNYGEFAKWPLAAVPTDGLKAYLSGVTKSIDNPAKAKFKTTNIKMRAAILEALATRTDHETPDSSASPQASPPPEETPSSEESGPHEPSLNAVNICQQFRLCESIAEWSQVANSWQEESHLHSDEERQQVKTAADAARKRLGKK